MFKTTLTAFGSALFRRRSSPSPIMARFAEIVHLPPDALVEMARDLIWNLNPNGGVMTLMAYMNVNPILGAMKDSRRQQVDAGITTDLIPNSIDDLIVFVCAEDDKLGNSAQYEIPRRRGLWFLHALIVMKANEVAQRSPERVRSVVDIWVHLIACSRVLRKALEHNVLGRTTKNVGLAVRIGRSLW